MVKCKAFQNHYDYDWWWWWWWWLTLFIFILLMTKSKLIPVIATEALLAFEMFAKFSSLKHATKSGEISLLVSFPQKNPYKFFRRAQLISDLMHTWIIHLYLECPLTSYICTSFISMDKSFSRSEKLLESVPRNRIKAQASLHFESSHYAIWHDQKTYFNTWFH